MQAPGLTRRHFIGGSAALALGAGARAETQDSLYAYVGTYTPNGGGIYVFRFDAQSASMIQLQVVDGIRNPSWLTLSPDRTRLYAVSEIDDFEGTRTGAVVGYAIDGAGGRLTRLNAVSSQGGLPAHLSVHPSGSHLFVANYGGGNVAVLPLGADGTLGAASDVRPSVGSRHPPHAADDPPGQFAQSDHEGPHMHMVGCDPAGQFVIANDAGLDLTLVWRFDPEHGRLLPAEKPAIIAPSGSAPRHFVFHPSGRWFYNLYEHDAKIAVYDYDSSRGRLRHKQTVSTLPPKFAGSNLSSEIVITADGRYLYAANRLHNTIAAYAVDGDGQLRGMGEIWVHADYPRHIAIDPTGQYVLSCNQRGDSITSFKIGAAGGALQFTGRYQPVGSPAVIVLLAVARDSANRG